MRHTENDTEIIEMQQNDVQNPETESTISIEDNEERTFYQEVKENNTTFYASANENDSKDDEEEEDEEDDEEEESGDWGHVDPAESNGPFSDPNAPTAPGSAV